MECTPFGSRTRPTLIWVMCPFLFSVIHYLVFIRQLPKSRSILYKQKVNVHYLRVSLTNKYIILTNQGFKLFKSLSGSNPCRPRSVSLLQCFLGNCPYIGHNWDETRLIRKGSTTIFTGSSGPNTGQIILICSSRVIYDRGGDSFLFWKQQQ